MIGLARWANAVASAGTRAIAPPRTRIWATRIEASDASSRSTIVSATVRSTHFMKNVLPTAFGWYDSSSGG